MPREYESLTYKRMVYRCDVTGKKVAPESIFMRDGDNILSREGYELIPEPARDPSIIWLVVRSLNPEQEPSLYHRSYAHFLKKLAKGIYALAVGMPNKEGKPLRCRWVDNKDAQFESEMKRFYDLEECKEFVSCHCRHVSASGYIVFLDAKPVLRGTTSNFVVEVTND